MVDSTGFGQNIATIVSANAGIATTNCLSLGIKNNILENDFKIFPNPSIGNINLELESPMKNAHVQIINTIGIIQMDLQIELTNKTTINTENLIPGLYWINVVEENRKYSKKFLVQN